ncbi:hypothetical protein [Mucilaginibacter sp.]|uniref:hypothetical protein n=1 Tax=Mucilaginibacter sp. TaxID=1882438 RepID=UPI003262CF13
MIKASALYIVIIIALVIAVLCSALVATAYFYREEYQKKFRYDRLQNNLTSGINYLLAGSEGSTQNKTFSLFNNPEDSVTITRRQWGVYEMATCQAFIQHDTLFKTFSIANSIDSAKWAALYLIDEDRPLSVSGKTSISGNVYIPKAGIRTAYVDNKAYEGDKDFVKGHQYNSEKSLPPLNPSQIDELLSHFTDSTGRATAFRGDSVYNSFLNPTRVINLPKKAAAIADIKINGNIILYADTTLTIDSTATLNNTMVFARAIVIKSGFKGNCQLFATDSIRIEPRCHLEYPSAIGIIRTKNEKVATPPKLFVGNASQISGVIFSYDKEKSEVPIIISLDKNVIVYGQVYSQGTLSLKDGVKIYGSVSANRFLYQNSYSAYENYLINLEINSRKVSPHYLSGSLFPAASKTKKVLQWIEGN